MIGKVNRRFKRKPNTKLLEVREMNRISIDYDKIEWASGSKCPHEWEHKDEHYRQSTNPMHRYKGLWIEECSKCGLKKKTYAHTEPFGEVPIIDKVEYE